MYTIFNFLENFVYEGNKKKINIFIHIIFNPIFLLLEYICYIKFWKKIVIRELFESDEIVDFFDKNEFGYDKKIIKKADLLSSNEFYDRFSLEEAKHAIKNDFVNVLSELIKQNISIDIEDLITLIVNTEVRSIKNQNKIYSEKIYEVIIQFSRYYYFIKNIRETINWFIVVSILSIIFGITKYFYF